MSERDAMRARRLKPAAAGCECAEADLWLSCPPCVAPATLFAIHPPRPLSDALAESRKLAK